MGTDQYLYFCHRNTPIQSNENGVSPFIRPWTQSFHKEIVQYRNSYQINDLFRKYGQCCRLCRCGCEPLGYVFKISMDNVKTIEKILLELLDFYKVHPEPDLYDVERTLEQMDNMKTLIIKNGEYLYYMFD